MKFTVIHDALEPCPYLPGQEARMPLRLPRGLISPDAFDGLLALGERRSGPVLYTTQCPRCSACEAIRVPVRDFQPSRTQRKTLGRNADLEVVLGPPQLTPRHVELYNRHKLERGLSRDGARIDAEGYASSFLLSCVDTREVQYRLAGELIAVSILDFGRTACSGVYHFFDPDHAHRSLGVFSKLKEIELCGRLGLEWFYLGLYVAACGPLAYKATYHPHQRRIDGVWTDFPG